MRMIRSPPSKRCQTERSGGTSSPRKSRSRPKRSLSSGATTNTTSWIRTSSPSRRDPGARAMGRPRGHEQLVARGAVTRAEHLRKKYTEPNAMIFGRARIARHSTSTCRCRVEPTEAGRVYRKISYGPLLDVFMLDMRTYRGPNGENKQRIRPRRLLPWPTSCLAQARAAGLAADLEGDRRRHAAGVDLTYDVDRKFGSEAIAQSDNGPPLGRELEIADLLSFIKQAANPEHGLADSRRALHGRPLLRPEQGRVSGFDPFWEFVSGPIHAGNWDPKSDRQDVRATSGLCESATEGLELLRSPE